MSFTPRCNGNGMIRCRCAGDFCICGMDGEECFGCALCEEQDADFMDYDDDDFGDATGVKIRKESYET